MKFVVLAAVNNRTAVLWDVTPFSLVNR